ncbi:alpha/beta fold hydrolase [Chitinasiproducens palmae]|nr:alpha/beta hydrolase [Chitinasiproducens palmae]
MAQANDLEVTQWQQRLARFPLASASAGAGRIVYRDAGAGTTAAVPLVLLHGIGSGSPSWVAQLEGLSERRRVLAWDAPGYAESTPVQPASPHAEDYAAVLEAWLDALGIARVHLVGHSLGALMAGAFARRAPERLASLLLLAPAGGYGAAEPAIRDEKRRARLALLDQYGPAGLAERRSGNLNAPGASEAARAWVRWNMARIRPDGYRQATELLANGDLAGDLSAWRAIPSTRGPVRVAVGSDDAITTPQACARIAAAADVALDVLPGLGHACYIEDGAGLTTLIEGFVENAEHQA